MAPADSNFGLAQIGQIGVTVTDLDRTVAFYRDTLGMKFLFRVPNMVFFDCAGIRLMLGLAEANGEAFHPILFFRVDDIQKAADTLAQRGIVFEAKPAMVARLEKHDLWIAGISRSGPERNRTDERSTPHLIAPHLIV
jgi:catechol 2,3-dioxygenase-like lactoylglutathione lyase family enzyme